MWNPEVIIDLKSLFRLINILPEWMSRTAGCGQIDFKVVAIISAPVSKLYPNLGHLEMLPDLRNYVLIVLKE